MLLPREAMLDKDHEQTLAEFLANVRKIVREQGLNK
jgi:hypothetical protein